MLGDPWDTISQKHPVGSVVEGPITNVTEFGAFAGLADGLEGMITFPISPRRSGSIIRARTHEGAECAGVVLEIGPRAPANPVG